MELTPSHDADVAGMRVRRALPRASRRMVGAWCFIDHMGPMSIPNRSGVDVGPHPHTALQTVTWLIEGEALHRDSLGSEQPIRPGQLNLMTAGHGIVHSEEAMGSASGSLHGVQFWVAQPESTRHDHPAFDHHPHLPDVDVSGARATVLVGTFAGGTSPARRDTNHVGVDLVIARGRALLPLDPHFEYAVVVLVGAVVIDGQVVVPGALAYLGTGRDELVMDTQVDTHLVLVGGEPFGEKISMFWNFVARSRSEIETAVEQWSSGDPRFGDVDSRLERIASPPPPWRTSR